MRLTAMSAAAAVGVAVVVVVVAEAMVVVTATVVVVVVVQRGLGVRKCWRRVVCFTFWRVCSRRME